MKFLNPSNLFRFLNISINFIRNIFLPIIIVSLIFALIFSPKDYIQGDSVRIMYVHVPAAWIALMCFGLIAFVHYKFFI